MTAVGRLVDGGENASNGFFYVCIGSKELTSTANIIFALIRIHGFRIVSESPVGGKNEERTRPELGLVMDGWYLWDEMR